VEQSIGRPAVKWLGGRRLSGHTKLTQLQEVVQPRMFFIASALPSFMVTTSDSWRLVVKTFARMFSVRKARA